MNTTTTRTAAALDQALAAAIERYRARHPASARQLDIAAEVLPGGNTRSVLYQSPFPLVMVRGQGCRLWDADGHELLDALGEFTAGLYGHSAAPIREAIVAALDGGIGLSSHTLREVELAREIRQRFPAMQLLRFTNSGTEANLLALAAAVAHTGRRKVLVFEGAYHGGVLSFGGAAGAVNVPHQWLLAPYNDLDAVRTLVARDGADLAAILVEPMLGAGGCIPGTPEFLQGLRRLADESGALLIFDEVMTSRMSSGGLQKKLGVTPDMTTFGKYLGGGLTFGAFGGRHELMRRYDPGQPDAWPHAGTFNNNVLTMAAGVAGLTKVFTPDVADRLYDDGERLRARLGEVGRKHGVPLQATGVGSIIVVHWQSAPVAQPHDTQKTPVEARALFHLNMLHRGYYLARRGFMALSLALTPADHDGFVAAVDDYCGAYRNVLREL